jgi:hypothetical protein
MDSFSRGIHQGFSSQNQKLANGGKKKEAENNGCHSLNQKMNSSKNLTKRKIYSSYNNQ